MNVIINLVKGYLSNPDSTMPEALIEEFGEACKEALKKQFTKRDTAWSLRASSIGRPLCQQQLEKAGAERGAGYFGDFARFNFLIGDMIEGASVAVLKAAGVGVEELQTSTTTEIAGELVPGTLDIVIDGKVYDIKSSSPYMFTRKYSAPDAFNKLREDDPFGYISQAYIYSEGRGLPFGGWIAVNKATGEWTVAETPIVDRSYRKEALAKAAENIRTLLDDKPFQRCYEPVKETFRQKATGNYVLCRTCEFCSVKQACYEKEGLTYVGQPKSSAQFKPMFWYIGEVK